MTVIEEMAAFVARMSVEGLSAAGRLQLEIRILDTLGCALGALDAAPVRSVKQFVTDFSPDGLSTESSQRTFRERCSTKVARPVSQHP
jgi:2-methylcitrate dehydratase